MDYKESLEYLNKAQRYGSKPSLERINELLRRLGQPQREMKFVHIAGTNGKGSCAAMMASIFKTAGYRTGLFTSPYLHRFNERMRVNNKEIDDEVFAEIMTRIAPLAEDLDEHPTAFELIFATSLIYFLDEHCDIVILEAGLGGRFDATNAIDTPECAVIMNIGLDHTEILGDTVEKIAFENAGIIKHGGSCVVYGQDMPALDILRERCQETDAEMRIVDFSEIEPQFDSLEGQVFNYKDKTYALPLLGENQLKNAAVVIETTQILRERGWSLEQTDIEHGLYAVSWPARFELAEEEPYFVIDGGHNPQCAETVRDNLLHYFPDKKRIIIFGMLKDKEYKSVAEILADAADDFITVTPDSERALSASALAEVIETIGKRATAFSGVSEAVDAAKTLAGESGVVCAVGSMYLAGEVRYCLGLY